MDLFIYLSNLEITFYFNYCIRIKETFAIKSKATHIDKFYIELYFRTRNV